MVNYRTLGKTGFRVSEIGFGTWQLANDRDFWVGATEKESLACLHKAVDLGLNFIDTAWVYGDGASERLIGRFLRESGRREGLYLASKVPPKNMFWPAKPDVPIAEVFPGDWIVQCTEDSLRRLGVETLDLMQFHVWQDDFVEDDGWKETIAELTRQGKVKFWGISVNRYEPDNCLRTLETGLIASIQAIFNIFHQKPIEALFPACERLDVGVIARVPLDEGGLSGKITLETKFPEGDFRSRYFGGERRKELVERVARLGEVMGDEAKTIPELALRFCLSFDAVSTVIPGMRKVEHVEENTQVSDGRRLSPELLEKLRGHAWEHNFHL
jgi:aryl-alcohol dehydrogenase-like predicted oxidoreductase